MRTAICDDDLIFLKSFQNILQDEQVIDEVEIFSHPQKLMTAIQSGSSYDLIFMDIDYGNQPLGLEQSKKLYEICPDTIVIYVTAYNDRFSERIFFQPTNLCGYLVKPVKKESLAVLLRKAVGMKKEQNTKRLYISKKGEERSIAYEDILYLESCAHQVVLHLKTENVSVYEKLDTYEKELSGYFTRCHKSYLVNMEVIEKIADSEISLRGLEYRLPVSRAKLEQTKKDYMHFLALEI